MKEVTYLSNDKNMNPITITSFKRLRTREDAEMDFEMSKAYKGRWSGEREWGSAIMEKMKSIGLKFKLDNLTRGNGSCLMIAVLQQLNQPELYSQLPEEVKPMVDNLDHQRFRWFVRNSAEAFKVSNVFIIKHFCTNIYLFTGYLVTFSGWPFLGGLLESDDE